MKLRCNEVLDLMVDYIEENLTKKQSKEIKAHLEDCTACALEYDETKALIGENLPQNLEIHKEYFENMQSNIIKNIEEYEKGICEETQDSILLLEKELDPQMQKHLYSCTKCQSLQAEIQGIENLLADITVEVPQKQFFKTQLSRITWRLSYDEKTSNISFNNLFKSIGSAFEYFIRPTSILVMSGTLAILLVLNVFVTDNTSQEEKVIYLSELLNKTNIESSSNKMPNPSYEQKLNMEATGTAKLREETKKRYIKS